jgi:hypothetical protein
VTLLQGKYRDTPVDLVIASGIEPLQFAARHRDAIWPGAAIVFNGVFEGSLDGWQRPPRTTGVTVTLDIEQTVALGRALVPGRTQGPRGLGLGGLRPHLLELAGASSIASSRTSSCTTSSGSRARKRGARGGAATRFARALSLMLRDATGQISGPGVPTLQWSPRAPACPCSRPSRRSSGAVRGGLSPRYDEHGAAAGRLARRLLEGEAADRIPLHTEPLGARARSTGRRCSAGRPERNVPAGCNAHQPARRRRAFGRWWRWVDRALQAALIWSLAMQNRRRRRAEAELRPRRGDGAGRADVDGGRAHREHRARDQPADGRDPQQHRGAR